MMKSRIEHLLIKYIAREANALEIDELQEWIKDPKNEVFLKSLVKTHYTINIAMNDPRPDKIEKQLLHEIRKDKNLVKNRRFRSFMKYAAIALFFTCIGYFFQQYHLSSEQNEQVIPKEQAVTLQMDDGELQKVTKNGSLRVKDQNGAILGEQIEGSLIYRESKNTKELKYNILHVPYGKTFDVFLSDGTHVFLNAGSSLRYPVSFLTQGSRQVFLEGEAYFDVTHDAQRPFQVGAQEIRIQVYGTKFNVSNYASDENIDVVLVEGSVALETKGKIPKKVEKLMPGFKGVFDKTKKTLSAGKVDTTIYTAWMSGNLVFRNTPFATIIKKLGRQYNVIIINNNKALSKEAFNATIETKKESIEQVFEYFNEVYNIDYQIINNKIIIN